MSAPGELVWERTIGAPGQGTSGIAADLNGNIYVVGGEAMLLHSLDSAGNTNWTYGLDGNTVGQPVVRGDRIYLCSNRGGLKVINTGGAFQWSFTNDNYFIRPPVIGADGTVYLSTKRRNSQSSDLLTALGSEGSHIWTIRLNECRPMQTVGGEMRAGDRFGQLLAIRTDGSTGWTTNFFSRHGEGALDAAGNVYSAAVQKSLYSFDSVGEQRWAYALPDAGNPPEGVALDETGRIVFQDGAGKLVCLNPNGTLGWDYAMPDDNNRGPAIASDGSIYACSRSGELHAVSSTGVFQWKFVSGETCYTHPLLLQNGDVVIVTFDSKVYRIEGGGAGPANSSWPMVGGGAGRHASLQTSVPLPAIPSGVTSELDAFTYQVNIVWASADHAQTYAVYRSSTADFNDAEMITDGLGGGLTFSDHGAPAGRTLYYWVQSQNSAGSSAVSNPVQGRRATAADGDFAHRLPYPAIYPPAISDDESVTFVCADGVVRSVSSTGSLLWEFVAFSGNVAQFAGHPVIGDDGNVLVAVNFRDEITNDLSDGTLIVLSSGGMELWRENLEQIIWPPAVAPDGNIVISIQEDWLNPQAGTGGVYAYDVAGQFQWFYPVVGGVIGTPVIQSDGTIFFGGLDRFLRSLNSAGGLNWSYDIQTEFGAPVRPGPEGRIYVLANGLIRMFSPAGNIEWTAPAVDLVSGNALVDSNGNLLAEGGDIPRKFFSYAPDGTRNWDLNLASGYLALAEGDELLLLVGRYLHRFDTNGIGVGSYSFNQPLYKPFNLGADGVVWIATDTELFGLQTSKGLGDGMWSLFAGNKKNQNRFTITLEAPSVPPLLSAAMDESATHVLLEWTEVSEAQEYEIWKSESDVRTEGAQLAADVSGTLSYEDRTAIVSTTNYYWIRAKNSSGDGPWSVSVQGSVRPPIIGEILETYQFLFSGVTWDAISAPAVSSDGTVYVGAARTNVVPGWDPHHFLAALNVDGGVEWEYPSIATVKTIPTVTSGGLNVIISDAVRVVDSEGGLIWEISSAGHTPAIAENDDVVFLGYDGTISRLNIGNGQTVWSIDNAGGAENDYRRTPAIGPDGTIFYVTEEETLIAVTPDGRKLWESSHYQFGVRATPVPGADGLVYVGGENGLHAFFWDGTLAYEKEFPEVSNVNSPVFDVSGNIYFATLSGHIVSLDAEGATRWLVDTGSSCYSEVLVTADDKVIFGSDDGKVRALNSADGTPAWDTDIGTEIRTSPVLAASGRLFVRGNDGNVYSIWSGSDPSAGGWFMFRGNAARTGRSASSVSTPAPPGISSITKGTDHRRITVNWWSVPDATHYEIWRSIDAVFENAVRLEDAYSGSTSYADEQVVVGAPYYYWIVAANAKVKSLESDSASGWIRSPVAGDVLNEYSVRDGGFLRYFPSSDGSQVFVANRFELLAFDFDLNLNWTNDITDIAYSSASPVPGGRVMVLADGGSTSDLLWYSADGSLEGARALTLRPNGSPAMRQDGGSVWTASDLGVLVGDIAVSFSPVGEIEWEMRLPSALNGQPVLDAEGTSFFNGGSGWVYAISRQGVLTWSNQVFQSSSSIISSPAIGMDGPLYLPVQRYENFVFTRDIVVIDYRDGSMLSTIPFDKSIYGTPLISDNNEMLVSHFDGTLKLFTSSRTIVWTNKLAGYPRPVRTSDGDYLVASAGGLDFLDGDDGRVRWMFRPKLETDFSQPIILDTGNVVVGDSWGELRLFYSEEQSAREGWNYPGGDASGSYRSSTLVRMELTQPVAQLVAAEPYSIRSKIVHDSTVAEVTWFFDGVPIFTTGDVDLIVQELSPKPGLNRWRLSISPVDGQPILGPEFNLPVSGPRMTYSIENGKTLTMNFYAHFGFVYQPIVTTNFVDGSAFNLPIVGADAIETTSREISAPEPGEFLHLQVFPQNDPN